MSCLFWSHNLKVSLVYMEVKLRRSRLSEYFIEECGSRCAICKFGSMSCWNPILTLRSRAPTLHATSWRVPYVQTSPYDAILRLDLYSFKLNSLCVISEYPEIQNGTCICSRHTNEDYSNHAICLAFECRQSCNKDGYKSNNIFK